MSDTSSPETICTYPTTEDHRPYPCLRTIPFNPTTRFSDIENPIDLAKIIVFRNTIAFDKIFSDHLLDEFPSTSYFNPLEFSFRLVQSRPRFPGRSCYKRNEPRRFAVATVPPGNSAKTQSAFVPRCIAMRCTLQPAKVQARPTTVDVVRRRPASRSVRVNNAHLDSKEWLAKLPRQLYCRDHCTARRDAARMIILLSSTDFPVFRLPKLSGGFALKKISLGNKHVRTNTRPIIATVFQRRFIVHVPVFPRIQQNLRAFSQIARNVLPEGRKKNEEALLRAKLYLLFLYFPAE